jgi:hypothetical protein
MRSYKEILSFLIIREQLSLGWKFVFFIVCAALLYASVVLSHWRIESTEILGTVLNDRADLKEESLVDYLTIQLDNGDRVQASAAAGTGYRPGRKVIVNARTTNFFGMRKHEVKRYVDERDRK